MTPTQALLNLNSHEKKLIQKNISLSALSANIYSVTHLRNPVTITFINQTNWTVVKIRILITIIRVGDQRNFIFPTYIYPGEQISLLCLNVTRFLVLADSLMHIQ